MLASRKYALNVTFMWTVTFEGKIWQRRDLPAFTSRRNVASYNPPSSLNRRVADASIGTVAAAYDLIVFTIQSIIHTLGLLPLHRRLSFE
jgi:hypothetical protein